MNYDDAISNGFESLGGMLMRCGCGQVVRFGREVTVHHAECAGITWQAYAEKYGPDALPPHVDPHAFVPVAWITTGQDA